MNYYESLREGISSKNLTVAVIGMGYVGVPLLTCFASKGFTVLGVDVDDTKIEALSNSISPFSHIPSGSLKDVKNNTTFTVNYAKVDTADVIVICVPTPVDKRKKPDLTSVKSVIERLLSLSLRGKLIILESTTYPGCTREHLVCPFELMDMTVGTDVFVGYSPEREDPGNESYSTKQIPKVVSGYTSKCRELCSKLYSEIIEHTVEAPSLEVAEASKLLENTQRAVNIALVNEFKLVMTAMGIDINEVIDCAATKPFGFSVYRPGPGVGGHCIPVDPWYYTAVATNLGIDTPVTKHSLLLNAQMPAWLTTEIKSILAEKGKTLQQSRILILGVAYKGNIADPRESPTIEILPLLSRAGSVTICDPFIPFFNSGDSSYTTTSINEVEKSEFDIAVIMTDHSVFRSIDLSNVETIIDTRRLLPGGANVVQR